MREKESRNLKKMNKNKKKMIKKKKKNNNRENRDRWRYFLFSISINHFLLCVAFHLQARD